MVAGWWQGGGRVVAGWRRVGGRVAARWRQGGGRGGRGERGIREGAEQREAAVGGSSV